jgi:hypothetical protein
VRPGGCGRKLFSDLADSVAGPETSAVKALTGHDCIAGTSISPGDRFEDGIISVASLIPGDGQGINVLLGVKENLPAFSELFEDGQTWDKWSGSDFQSDFKSVMRNPNNTINFNLDGPDGSPINPWLAASKGLGEGFAGKTTNWEIAQIKSNPGWWPRVTFWQGGGPIDFPF